MYKSFTRGRDHRNKAGVFIQLLYTNSTIIFNPKFLQMLSRTKPAVGPGSGNTVSSAKDSKKKRKLPKTEDFLQMRDFTGAITLLEVSLGG